MGADRREPGLAMPLVWSCSDGLPLVPDSIALSRTGGRDTRPDTHAPATGFSQDHHPTMAGLRSRIHPDPEVLSARVLERMVP